MNDVSQVIAEQTAAWLDTPWPWLGLGLLLLLVLIIWRRPLREGWRRWRTRRCLGKLGLEQIGDLRCPDGLGGHFVIDRLLLRHDGITLLKYKQYPGRIFCADRIEQWTQMLGQKSYKFDNPLFELDYQIKAIQSCIPGIDVDGYLFFDHQAEFPKGHPRRVIHPQALPDALTRNDRHKALPEVMEAWRKLKALAGSA